MSFLIPSVGLITIVWVVRVGALSLLAAEAAPRDAVLAVIEEELDVDEGVGVGFPGWVSPVGLVLLVIDGVGVVNNVLIPTPALALPDCPAGTMVVSIGTTIGEVESSCPFSSSWVGVGAGSGSEGGAESEVAASDGDWVASAAVELELIVDEEIVYTADQVDPVYT